MSSDDTHTARPLSPVSASALEQFDAVSARVEEDVVRQSLAQDRPEETMGDEAAEKMRVGLTFVTRMLRATMTFGAEGIMADEMKWGRDRLPVYGVSMKMVLANLQRYRAALELQMPAPAFDEVRPYLERTIARQRGITGG